MQPHDNDQRPSEGNTDGGRNAERNADLHALRLAFTKIFNTPNGQVYIAEHGKPVNMGAALHGTGKMVG